MMELARVQFRLIAPRPSALAELDGSWYEPIQVPLPELPAAAAVTPALLVLALDKGARVLGRPVGLRRRRPGDRARPGAPYAPGRRPRCGAPALRQLTEVATDPR
ncbi:MAG: hypothetical protein IPG94_22190 [Kineosporiaceae bacterium]|nr:hypothetical protein [Kineosporiaceae bacterium]